MQVHVHRCTAQYDNSTDFACVLYCTVLYLVPSTCNRLCTLQVPRDLNPRLHMHTACAWAPVSRKIFYGSIMYMRRLYECTRTVHFMRQKVCLLFDFTVKSNYADVKAETIICIDLLRTTVFWCGECLLCYCILLHLLSTYKNFIIMSYPYENLYLVHWFMARPAAFSLHLVLHLVHLYDLLNSCVCTIYV